MSLRPYGLKDDLQVESALGEVISSTETLISDTRDDRREMDDIISVEDLVVVYQDGTRAVDGISFAVKEGEFFGFLGPNGAGKSTVIKTLTTLLRKTSGRVSVAGVDLDSDPAAIRKSIGVLTQETSLDVDLTGRENLRLQGRLQQMHGRALDERVEEVLKLVELDKSGTRRPGDTRAG